MNPFARTQESAAHLNALNAAVAAGEDIRAEMWDALLQHGEIMQQEVIAEITRLNRTIAELAVLLSEARDLIAEPTDLADSIDVALAKASGRIQ